MDLGSSMAVKLLGKKGNRMHIIYALLSGVVGVIFLVVGIMELLREFSTNVLAGPIIGFVLIIVALIFVNMIIKKKNLKHINRYFEEHPETSISEIDKDFTEANKVFKKLWIGDKCTYYVGQMYPNIIENKELIWVYLTHGSGTNGYWQLNFCEKDTRMTLINIKSEKKAKEITGFYNEKFKHLVVGYSDELNNLFNNDLEKFLDLKYNQNV